MYIYLIRKPTFHLPVIRHEFPKQLIKYKLLERLNTESGTVLISSKVHTQSFIGLKIYIKNKVTDSYSYICNKVVCEHLSETCFVSNKCYVVIDLSSIVVLVIFYFVYVFNLRMGMYVYIYIYIGVYIMLYMFTYKLW